MRHFGQYAGLGNSLRRAIDAQMGVMAFPKPTYYQTDVGYPYSYGSPSNQAAESAFTPERDTRPQTSREDIAVEGIRQGGETAQTFIEGLFGYKTAKLGVSGEPVAASYQGSSGGGNTALWIGLGLAGVLGVGLIAFIATRD